MLMFKSVKLALALIMEHLALKVLQNKQHNIILQKSHIFNKPGLHKTVGENHPSHYLGDQLLNVIPKCASDDFPLGNG